MDAPNVLSLWTWEPSVLILWAVFLAAYLLTMARFAPEGEKRGAHIAWFGSGMLVILAALVSPLDALGDGYLFSAHMIQHTLLAIVAPPLLLAGTPGWLAEALILRLRAGWLAKALTRPVAAFLLFNGIFMGFHFPALFETTLHNEGVHILEHLLFISTGILNWWPVIGRAQSLTSLPPPGQLLYLFLEAIPSTVLGAIISFSPMVFYPTYAAAPRLLNLSPIDDQQIAGLVMAMPAGMVYLAVLSVVFFKLAGAESRAADRALESRNPRR